MKKKDEAHELNKEHITLEEFLKAYNVDIPKTLPRASISILKRFASLNPTLFKDKGLWSIDQHRKKLIDWFFSNSHKE